MDRWMDEWMKRWINCWRWIWTDGRSDKWNDWWMDTWMNRCNLYLLSFWVMVPFSSLAAMEANTLLASLAKSRSRTSAGDTGTIAKASLSSLRGDVPIWDTNIEWRRHTSENPQTNATVIHRQKLTHSEHDWFLFLFIYWLVGAVDPRIGAEMPEPHIRVSDRHNPKYHMFNIKVLNHKLSQKVIISLYLGTSESPPLRVVGSSSKIDEMSFPSGTDTSVYITLSWGLRARARIISSSESSCKRSNQSTVTEIKMLLWLNCECVSWNECSMVKRPSNCPYYEFRRRSEDERGKTDTHSHTRSQSHTHRGTGLQAFFFIIWIYLIIIRWDQLDKCCKSHSLLFLTSSSLTRFIYMCVCVWAYILVISV